MIAEHLKPRQQRIGRFVYFDYDASRRLAHLDYLDWREKAVRAGFLSGKTGGWRSTDEVFTAVAAQRAKRASNHVRVGRVLHQHQKYPD